jgi:hypothetical protein
MPTVKNIPGPYRFFFFSFDCNEPEHVHVQRENKVCKYWLTPLALGERIESNPFPDRTQPGDDFEGLG